MQENMNEQKVIETSKQESEEFSEVKERLEPTGMDAVAANYASDKEQKAGDDQIKVQPEQLNDIDRLVLFEKAVRLKRKGNNRHALQCFLCCLQGLREQAQFSVLPECLHHIAEIYNAEEDYERAIQFAQAEKLYYETALITANKDEKPQQSEDDAFSTAINDINTDNLSSQNQTSASATSDEAQKAEEYEKLAHMCLKQQNPQLALDYCAKAVKLQQACYGEQHPTTLQTLDLFTVIYAEMGKQQYKDAMEKFSAAQEKEKQAKQLHELEKDNTENQVVPPDQLVSDQNDDQRGSVDDEKTSSNEMNQQDRTQDNQTTRDTIQVTVTSSCAMALYFILTVLLALVMTATLCYLTQTDIHTTYNYIITRTKFYYYYYFVKKQPDSYKYF